MRPVVIKLAIAVVVLLVAAPLAAEAQPAGEVWRIGYLGNSSASLEPDLVDAFRQGLREFGHVEGRDIVIEYRWAEGRYDRFRELAAELVRLKVDIILTAGTPGTLAAKQATQTIPIVMAVAGDALAARLVPSLARPGGNVTGLSTLARELEGKRLELLKEIVPRLSRIAVLLNPSNPFTASVGSRRRRARRRCGSSSSPSRCEQPRNSRLPSRRSPGGAPAPST